MRPLLGLVAAVVGAVTGIASVALHDASWAWFVLTVAAPAAAVTALPKGWLSLGFALGWLAVVLVAIGGTSAGSYAISADLRGYAFLAGAMALMVGAIVSLPTPNRSEQHPSVG